MYVALTTEVMSTEGLHTGGYFVEEDFLQNSYISRYSALRFLTERDL